MGKRKQLDGNKFGDLFVERFSHMHSGHSYWLCRCECGVKTTVRGSHLLSGHTTSCGCQKGNSSHKGSGSRLYTIWAGMRERCNNPKSTSYMYYGARGILVCDEWKDFAAFRDWALENGYNDSLTIDRIDNNIGYCPGNCRWATATEQANNTRKTRMLMYDGEVHSVSEWARIRGIKQSTLSMRINKYGWSVEKSLRKDVIGNVS